MIQIFKKTFDLLANDQFSPDYFVTTVLYFVKFFANVLFSFFCNFFLSVFQNMSLKLNPILPTHAQVSILKLST